MLNNSNNDKGNLKKRFSSEESICHYTTITYKLNENEIIKNGGVTCIGSYCRCRDKKNCDCLKKIIEFVNK
jgi:hypothetical protein